MNIIDIIIIAIIALFTLFGFYRGFIQSVLNLGGGLLSFVSAFWLYPKLSALVSSNTDITRFISTYTDSGNILGDLDLSRKAVAGLSSANISEITAKAGLPDTITTLLQHNLEQQVFSPLGNLATNVGDYINQTILSVSINVLCFIVCFVGCFILVAILSNVLRAVFRFPVLKQLDWLAGGAFGFLLGVLICFIAFSLLPILESVVPLEEFRAMVDTSTLANIFENSDLIISIMNRKL